MRTHRLRSKLSIAIALASLAVLQALEIKTWAGDLSAAGGTAGRTVTVTTADNVNPGTQTSLLMALQNLQDGDTVAFNIPGSGPHYIKTPQTGYPVITRDNVTIDGYTQPGAAPNTNSIHARNSAQLK